jgi:hypothetical protein
VVSGNRSRPNGRRKGRRGINFLAIGKVGSIGMNPCTAYSYSSFFPLSTHFSKSRSHCYFFLIMIMKSFICFPYTYSNTTFTYTYIYFLLSIPFIILVTRVLMAHIRQRRFLFGLILLILVLADKCITLKYPYSHQ